MPIKHIIFDWDGTLADTIPTLKAAYDETFRTLHLPLMSYEEVKAAAGKHPNRNIFQNVFGEDSAEEAKSIFYNFFQKHHLRLLKPFPDAEKLLQFCRKNKISCHILSNKKRKYLDEELAQLNWNQYFSKILGAGELEHDKPHHDACAALFGNQCPKPEEMLVLGDGIADVMMAEFWHCPVAIFDSKGTYNGTRPDYTIRNLNEFINLIESLNNE